MTEIAQLFESALRNNRASLLRKAAMNTVAQVPPSTTLHELLRSDAGEALRQLTFGDLRQALADAGLGRMVDGVSPRRQIQAASRPAPFQSPSESWTAAADEERIYRRILDAMSDEPLTIGQLAKRVDVDVDELRGYLNWMKKMGKVSSAGRARATRYQITR